MRKSAIFFVILFLLTAGSYVLSAVSPSDPAELSTVEQQMTTKMTVMKNVASMPLTFTPNQGQWDSRVLYRADAGRAIAWFTSEGVTYQFIRPLDGQNILDPSVPVPDPQPKEIKYERMTLRADIVNAKQNPIVTGEKQIDYKCNYFYGNDPTKWHTNVPNYETITYIDIYPGIDLKYYGNRQRMEYDFVVSPGVDPSQIRIHYDGVKSMSVDEKGQLVLETEWGPVTELTPIVYQMNGSEKIALSGEYVVTGESSFGFKLNDAYNPDLALVIDPEIGFSTFLGAADYEYTYGIEVADDGAVFVAGQTSSTGFPFTPNAYDTTENGDYDVFVSKFNPAGSSLLYSTFVGGTAYDRSNDIKIDPSGAAYVAGYTYSDNFPTTSGSIDETWNGDYDIFVFKLSENGDSLVYSTYYGGSAYEICYGIAVSENGRAAITGYTVSANFPVVRAFDDSQNGGSYDAFIAEFAAAGDSIMFSTYYGGSSDEYARGISIDDLGRICVVGYTYSNNLPLANPYDASYYAGASDCFVIQLSAAGDSLLYGSYFGGSSYDVCYNISDFVPGVSDNRYIYVTGYTSGAFPITGNGYDGSFNGYSDAIIMKLAPSVGGAGSLVYSTFFGGSNYDYGWGIAEDRNGNICISGYTYSSNLPMVNYLDNSLTVSPDGFIAKIVPGLGPGSSLIFSTYLGGNNSDILYDLALDGHNNIYAAGYTYSTDFPTTTGAFDESYNANADVFLTKIDVFTADQTNIAIGTSNGNYSSMSVDFSGQTIAPTGNIFYRLGGDVAYASGSFVTGASTFTFNFPAGWTATRPLEYYLELHSGSYDEYVGGAGGPIVYTPLLSNVQGHRPDQTEARRFKMIGVPIALAGDSSCSAVFADDLGGNYKSDWRLASYDTENHRYAEYAGSAPVKPGQGYWLITKGVADYGAVGRAVVPNRVVGPNSYYEVPLDSGWNLVANPFPFNVTATEILLDTSGYIIAGWPTAVLDPTAYWYSGTDYVGVNIIPLWDAFFVNIKKHNVTALFPYHKAGAAPKLLPLANAYPRETGSSDWQIQLRMRAGDYIDDGNFVGVRSDAFEGLDDYDYGEPPPPPDGPSLALKSNENDTYLKRCDFRPPFDDGAEWYLTFTDLPDRILTVSGIENIPYGMDAWLILDNKSKMHLEDGSAINLPDGVTTARLVIGDENYLKDNESIVVPKVFSLEQNYPNPFNPITTIKFALPEPASVRLEIYNLLGQRVTTLIDKELPAGDYSAVWEGTDDAGQPVASGMYLYKIEAGKYKASKKMMLLK